MAANGPAVEAALGIAEDVLFPSAMATDAGGAVPVPQLDRLAEAGLYGLVGPLDAGGMGAEPATTWEVIEILAAGCLSTTFVWIQHNGALAAVAGSTARSLRDEWLVPLCQGRCRAGIAVAGLRPGARLEAIAVPGGWRLDGTVPWVTGWGAIDVVHTGARNPSGDIVWALVDAEPSDSLSVEVIPLVAVQASATVVVHFDGHFVPGDRVTSIEPHDTWTVRDAAGLRPNGSLALGVARRCCRLLGPGRHDGELAACRAGLDAAAGHRAEIPAARAAASELAVRAASTLIVASGSRSIVADHHAQRLAREALFLLVFGTRPSIRDSLLARLLPAGPG